jgi:hypothetical protein
LVFANIPVLALPRTQANPRAAVAQLRYATASLHFRLDYLRRLPTLRTFPPEREREAAPSQCSRQNAPLGRKRHLPCTSWLPTPRPLADLESLTSSLYRRRRCRRAAVLSLLDRLIFVKRRQGGAGETGSHSRIGAPIPHPVDENESASLLRVRRQIFIGGGGKLFNQRFLVSLAGRVQRERRDDDERALSAMRAGPSLGRSRERMSKLQWARLADQHSGKIVTMRRYVDG